MRGQFATACATLETGIGSVSRRSCSGGPGSQLPTVCGGSKRDFVGHMRSNKLLAMRNGAVRGAAGEMPEACRIVPGECRRDAEVDAGTVPETCSSSSSSSSSSIKPPTPFADLEDDVSPEMVAQGVKQELGIGGVQVTICLMDICRAKINAGADPTKLRNDLIAAWTAYKAASEKLEWAYGSPEKFYASDKWHDPKLWPWKNGYPSRRLQAVGE